MIYPSPVANHFRGATPDQGSSIVGFEWPRSGVPGSMDSNRRLPAKKKSIDVVFFVVEGFKKWLFVGLFCDLYIEDKNGMIWWPDLIEKCCK